MNYNIVLDDPRLIAGVTAARNAYNATLPPKFAPQETAEDGTVTPGGELPVEQRDGFIATDEGYLSFVAGPWALSYANQYGVA